MKLFLIAFFYCLTTGNVRTQLIRDRSVHCNSTAMTVAFEFTRPFDGVVYADKHYSNRLCRWEGDGSRRLRVPLSLTTANTDQSYCGVQLNQANGEYSVMVLVSPVKGVLVDGAETLLIRCLYALTDVTLTLSAGSNHPGFRISPRTTANVVTGSGGSPFLQMAIRDGHGITGGAVQVAQVGQKITLDVTMQDTTVYDFYVHDCNAHDGSTGPEATIRIIDLNGCAVRLSRAVDAPVFTTNPGPTQAKHVYLHMYGFQFTTSQFVYFQCQVRPCLHTCDRPQCSSSSSDNTSTIVVPKRRSRASDPQRVTVASQENYSLTTVIRVEPQEIHASGVSAAAASMDDQDRSMGQLCMSNAVAISLLSVFAVVFLASLSFTTLVCHKLYSGTTSGRTPADYGPSIDYYSVKTTRTLPRSPYTTYAYS